jgi:acetyl esterase/lipase
VSYVTPDDPPFYLVAGGSDCTVPWRQSEIVDTALKAAGVSSVFEKVDGAGHGPGVFNPTTMDRVLKFLETSLKGCP